MLLATIAILGPALARLSRLPVFSGSEQGPFINIVTFSLLGAVIVHDVMTTRKVHPATVLGIVLTLGVHFVFSTFGGTDAGLAFVRWLQ